MLPWCFPLCLFLLPPGFAALMRLQQNYPLIQCTIGGINHSCPHNSLETKGADNESRKNRSHNIVSLTSIKVKGTEDIFFESLEKHLFKVPIDFTKTIQPSDIHKCQMPWESYRKIATSHITGQSINHANLLVQRDNHLFSLNISQYRSSDKPIRHGWRSEPYELPLTHSPASPMTRGADSQCSL